MRYDSQTDRLLLCAREAVAIARRGIAATSSDGGEPQLQAEEAASTVLSRELSYGEHRYLLSARCERQTPDALYFRFHAPGAARRLTRATVAQARGEAFLYAYLLSQGQEPPSAPLTLQICYQDDETGTAVQRSEQPSDRALSTFFHKCMAAVELYAAPEIERVTVRLPTMAAAHFPYGHARGGQQQIVRAVYRSIARGGTLLTAAPTGTGKTVSVLFPAVRALGDGRCEKIFYFTPKTTTAEAAADCLQEMARGGVRLCAVILTAKERLCEQGMLCREGDCPCQRGEQTRMAAAVLHLWQRHETVVAAERLRAVAREQGVCPYELSLCYAELCDAVICDVNYLFDPGVYLRRFFTEGGAYALLIDEAHNLPERAREMYSAELTYGQLAAPAQYEELGSLSELRQAASPLAERWEALFLPYIREELRRDKAGEVYGATHLSELPGDLFPLLEEALAVTARELTGALRARDEQRAARLHRLTDYQHRLHHFYQVATCFSRDYRCLIFYEKGHLRLKLLCLDPGDRIAERLRLGQATVFFSGTLSPLEYYRDTLGADRSAELLSVESPFDPSQLSVSIVDSITTRFSERDNSLLAICRVIAATVSARRGNYMVFTPSFRYAAALCDAFRAKYPQLHVMLQTPGMSEGEKQAFLAAFRNREDHTYLIGFCVMGGIWAEGIDLAGDSLIGAIVVGIGMPSLSYEREAMADYYEERYEAGKAYAYLYPGMNRVMQAAGRVIRREGDRGVIVLIDDRFRDPIYRKLIPGLWRGMQFIPDARTLKERIQRFWQETTEQPPEQPSVPPTPTA